MAKGMASFGANTTAEEVAAGFDLHGRVALVTGGSGGIGEETARVLASRGAQVVIAARAGAKLEAARERIAAAAGAAPPAAVELDLADFGSVRAAADTIAERWPAIDIIVANAGIMACPLRRNRDGIELQFATNHLGHFLLVCRLVPALRRAGSARVVVVSSAGHQASPVRFEDWNFEHSDYDQWVAYGQAKSANVLFAVELNRRLAPQVTANAVHPGVIPTDLGRHLNEEDQAMLATVLKSGRVIKTVGQGAATSVYAALAAELDGRGGLYLEDCHIGEPAGGERTGEGYMPWARDVDLAGRLWALSEQIVGERFSF